MKKGGLFLFIVLIGVVFLLIFNNSKMEDPVEDVQVEEALLNTPEEKKEEYFSMAIESLRKQEYLGGDFFIEKTLANGANYKQYIVSYKSEELKIFGLLTVPLALKPNDGFPAIVFVHGYIPPAQYSTTGSYPSYQATLAKAGFITFKPDLRGHGQSEGEAIGAHFSEKYTIDTLNAIAYLKNYKDVDPDKLGYWGHSNGGETGLRVAVVSKDIKAYSLWAGVVGSYVDELETYNDKISFMRGSNPLVEKYDLPSQNPEFWDKIDPYTYLDDIFALIQLQHATGDKSVPIELSRHLHDELQKKEKKVEYREYQGDDHNIGQNSSLAWERTIQFFRNNL
ncbi:MAG: alpha/beta fold hydrolase [Candidatus Moraniibacteriota bacterium]|nr:MAG: alpha/beta fold hydrolase [Candidatus Moranbacteria bacterium]